MNQKITLVGTVELLGSKCGLRYLELKTSKPYDHVVQVHLEATPEQDDDDLNRIIFDYVDRRDVVVTISTHLDAHDNLVAGTSDVTIGASLDPVLETLYVQAVEYLAQESAKLSLDGAQSETPWGVGLAASIFGKDATSVTTDYVARRDQIVREHFSKRSRKSR